MNWAGYTWLGLQALILFVIAGLHGKPLDGKWNVQRTLVCMGFEMWLLWCAGTFGR